MLEIITKAKYIYEIVFNAVHVEEDTKVRTLPSEAKVIDIISETELYTVR
jgi:hypothetical protein